MPAASQSMAMGLIISLFHTKQLEILAIWKPTAVNRKSFNSAFDIQGLAVNFHTLLKILITVFTDIFSVVFVHLSVLVLFICFVLFFLKGVNSKKYLYFRE